jgi:exonuclease-1
VVITEDSDLLPFGAKCVLYKLDYSSFKGEEICMETLNRNTDPNLSSFSHNMFVSACVLTGCDYLNQVKSIGIKGAFQLIAVHKTGLKAIKYLRSRVKEVPFDYEKEFVRAFLTFKLQVVYCPLLKKCVRLANLIPKNYGPKIKESELGNKFD